MYFFRYTKLRDDPGVRWREELVSDIVLQVRLGFFHTLKAIYSRVGLGESDKSEQAIRIAYVIRCSLSSVSPTTITIAEKLQ